MKLTATFAADLTASHDDPERVRRGMIVPFGPVGHTSAGALTVAAGAITVPEALTRIKLFREHDRSRPVAHLEAVEESHEGLTGAFRFGSTTAAEEARAELDEKLRDGLSVELDDVQIDGATITAATLTGVGLVAVPAFADARIAASTTEPPSPDPQPPTDEKAETMTEPAVIPTPIPAPATAVATAARAKPVSAAHELADRLRAARFDGGDLAVEAAITAALTDIVPGSGSDGLATQALGELLEEVEPTQYESIVSGRPLTGVKVEGWRWADKPKVADYSGNKTPIPSNPAGLETISAPAARIAGGHDLDRIYLDLGSSEVIVSYWRQVTQSLIDLLDAKRLEAVTAIGTPTAAASVAAAIGAGMQAIKRPSYVLISADLWFAESSVPEENVPALFGNGFFGGIIPSNVIVSQDVTGKVIVGRSSAVQFFTQQPPVRVEAVNVPHAGIDAGLYSYYGVLTVDSEGAQTYTVPVPGKAAGKK